MNASLLVRNVRPLGGPAVDVSVVDGRFAAFGAGLSPAPGATTVDGRGLLMLPGLVESHTHLDKTLWGQPWRPNTAGPALRDYIENERRVLAASPVPAAERARRLVRQFIATGTTHIRTHVDVDPDTGLVSVEALLQVREAHRDSVGLEIVAFPQQGMLIRPGTAELMERAIGMGVETVGGIDPAGIDNDPIGHLRIVFGIAERTGCGVDIHLHDGGQLGAWEIERIVAFTRAAGLAGRVMVSHAYCLGEIPQGQMEGIGRGLADQRIALMTSAPADGAIPPVAALRAMGVAVCCGSDGIRDAWSPFGNADMLERAMLLAYRFYWAKDEELAAALATVTTDAATALGLADYGLAPGRHADFVLVDAETVGEAVVARPQRALAARRGRITARDGKAAA